MTSRSLYCRIVLMDTNAQRKLTTARLALVDALGDRLDVWQTAALGRIVSELHRLVLDDPAPPECPTCATFLLQPATGRLRTYCSDACRQQQRRIRQRAAAPISRAAARSISDAGLTTSAYIRHHSPDGVWRGDSCGCTDDRCIGYHHGTGADCGCLPVLIDELGPRGRYLAEP